MHAPPSPLCSRLVCDAMSFVPAASGADLAPAALVLVDRFLDPVSPAQPQQADLLLQRMYDQFSRGAAGECSSSGDGSSGRSSASGSGDIHGTPSSALPFAPLPGSVPMPSMDATAEPSRSGGSSEEGGRGLPSLLPGSLRHPDDPQVHPCWCSTALPAVCACCACLLLCTAVCHMPGMPSHHRDGVPAALQPAGPWCDHSSAAHLQAGRWLLAGMPTAIIAFLSVLSSQAERWQEFLLTRKGRDAPMLLRKWLREAARKVKGRGWLGRSAVLLISDWYGVVRGHMTSAHARMAARGGSQGVNSLPCKYSYMWQGKGGMACKYSYLWGVPLQHVDAEARRLCTAWRAPQAVS